MVYEQGTVRVSAFGDKISTSSIHGFVSVSKAILTEGKAAGLINMLLRRGQKVVGGDSKTPCRGPGMEVCFRRN